MSTPEIVKRLSAVYVDCIKWAGRALASGDVTLARALIIKANSAGSALSARGISIPAITK